MSGLLSYSGLTTKIRAMQSHLLNDQNFREIVELESVPQAVSYLKQQAMRICLRATTKLTFTEVRSRKCCA